jgi:hypothetical protein
MSKKPNKKIMKVLYSFVILATLFSLLGTKPAVADVQAQAFNSVSSCSNVIFSDDFSTNKGWTDQSSGTVYRDTTNQRLVLDYRRDTPMHYYYPINGNSNCIQLELYFKVTGNSGNGLMWFGLAESNTAVSPVVAMDRPGIYFAPDTTMKMQFISLYTDGTLSFINGEDSTINYGSYNEWRKAILTVNGTAWTLQVYKDDGVGVWPILLPPLQADTDSLDAASDGTLLGTMSGTLPHQHTAYKYVMLAFNTVGWEHMTGFLDSVKVLSNTAASVPGAFNKTSPTSGATGQATSPTLSWGSSSGATSYEYCYDTSNDNACSSWVSTGTNTSVSLSGLSNNSTYYWQVRAQNSSGTTYANGSSTSYWSYATSPSITPTAHDFSIIDNNEIMYPCIPAWPIINFEVPGLVDLDVRFQVTNPELVDEAYIQYMRNGQTLKTIPLSLSTLETETPGLYEYTFFVPDTEKILFKLLELLLKEMKAKNNVPGTIAIPPNLLADNNIETDYGVIDAIVLVGKNGTSYVFDYPDGYVIKTINNRPVIPAYSVGSLRIRCPSVYFQAASPVDLLLIDDQGRRIGRTSSGVVQEIPNSYYSGPDVEHELIIISNPDSGTTFDLQVTGTGNGTYDLFYEYVGSDSYLEQSSSYEDLPIVPGDVDNYETTIPAPNFSDVSTNHWAFNWIKRLYSAGITSGCGNGNYCPENPVTRAEMAVFLERGMHGAAYTPPAGTGAVFVDVPLSYWADNWIEKLYTDGITTGCLTSPLSYCPNNPVTRAQMAKFLLLAKHGAAYIPPSVGTSTGFGDVATSYWAAAWIKQLAAEGITTGCTATTFCPDQPVPRAEMAKFLVLTFNLP